jgi:hypothetical protein
MQFVHKSTVAVCQPETLCADVYQVVLGNRAGANALDSSASHNRLVGNESEKSYFMLEY